MKITKLLMVVGVLSLLVAGSALAWEGPNKADMTYEERMEYRATQKPIYNSERTTSVDLIAELTGKSVEDVKELCAELRAEERTIADFLKEQGLYEEFKTRTIESFEDRIRAFVDNGRFDEERAEELIKQMKEKVENGELLNRTRTGINMKANAGKGRGRRS